ncbi:MAG: sodium:calcium antiporter [Thermoprotei archaeon]
MESGLLLTLSLIMLYVSSELLIRVSKDMAGYAGWSREAMGAVLISLSTALPEVFTGAISSLRGVPQVGVGTLLGSTVVVTTLVPSLLVLVKGKIFTRGTLGSREALASLVSTALAISLLMSGMLNRYTGVMLVFAYTGYVYVIARGEALDSLNPPVRAEKKKIAVVLTILAVSSILIYVSASYSISASLELASFFKIPEFLVGVLILGIGVELPEIIISLLSSAQGEKGMALGSIVGSNTAKALLGLGLMGALGGDLILPLNLAVGLSAFFAFVSPTLLYWFMKRGGDLTALDAVPLIMLYAFYVALII